MSLAMEIYEGLCGDVPVSEIVALRAQVRAHFKLLITAQRRNELIAIDLGQMLCDRLDGLLAMAHQFDSDVRAKIVGAARYFISTSDAVPDDRSCTGLDDDVEIFNHVVLAMDRPDLVISE